MTKQMTAEEAETYLKGLGEQYAALSEELAETEAATSKCESACFKLLQKYHTLSKHTAKANQQSIDNAEVEYLEKFDELQSQRNLDREKTKECHQLLLKIYKHQINYMTSVINAQKDLIENMRHADQDEKRP
jgi:hypothetical protein